MQGFEYQHNSSTYPLPSDMPPDIGPQNDPNVRDIDRAIDTRAAVSLLTRNIQIVSEGDDPSKTFSEMPSNYYYGGHTIVRQGFASFQVQGVEFAYLGRAARSVATRYTSTWRERLHSRRLRQPTLLRPR